MPKIKLYIDLMSQPCRALYIFFKLTKIPVEIIEISIKDGDHLKDSYTAINPFKKLPSISDNGFILVESIAIVRYLEREYTIDDHWYPKNSKHRALVDEYLEWHHNNTRICALYFKVKYYPVLRNEKPPDRKTLQDVTMRMETSLNLIENIWLNNGNYIVGDEISVADIFAACEIEQLKMADYNPFVSRPKLEKWLQRVQNETNPFYKDAHKHFNIMIHKL